jgi:hypothetical protein
MAHFAELNENDIVQRVIVINNRVILNDNNEEVEQLGINFCKSLYGENTNWVQASYNNNFRKQFAGIGFKYDRTNDVFISPQPYTSWSLDENFDWQAPTPYPEDGNNYIWNEETQQWDLITE